MPQDSISNAGTARSITSARMHRSAKVAALRALTTKVEKKHRLQAAEQRVKQQLESHEIDTQLAVVQAEEEAEVEAGTSTLLPPTSPPPLSSDLVSSWPLSAQYIDHPCADIDESDGARRDGDTQQLRVPRAIATSTKTQACKGAADSVQPSASRAPDMCPTPARRRSLPAKYDRPTLRGNSVRTMIRNYESAGHSDSRSVSAAGGRSPRPPANKV